MTTSGAEGLFACAREYAQWLLPRAKRSWLRARIKVPFAVRGKKNWVARRPPIFVLRCRARSCAKLLLPQRLHGDGNVQRASAASDSSFAGGGRKGAAGSVALASCR